MRDDSEKIRVVTLGDICTPKQWKTISSSDLIEKGYPVYGANGIIGSYSKYNHETETLLVTCRGATCGSLNICVPHSYINGNAMALDNLDDSCHIRFLYYYLKRRGFTDVISGSAQPQIIRSAIQTVTIPIPSLETQKKISKTLDTASVLLAMRKQQLAELDNLIKSTFYDMFGDPVANEKGWEIIKLSDCLSVIGGYAFKSADFSYEGIPIIKIGNINSGVFHDKGISFWKYDKKLDKYLLHPNDIIISLTGTVGKDDYANVCILPDKYHDYYLNQRNAKLELKDNINVYYLLHILKDTKIKRLLTGISRGIRQANISNADILSLNIPLPTLKLQTKFAEIVTKIEEQKTLVKKAIDETQYLFDNLMSEYFE